MRLKLWSPRPLAKSHVYEYPPVPKLVSVIEIQPGWAPLQAIEIEGDGGGGGGVGEDTDRPAAFVAAEPAGW